MNSSRAQPREPRRKRPRAARSSAQSISQHVLKTRGDTFQQNRSLFTLLAAR